MKRDILKIIAWIGAVIMLYAFATADSTATMQGYFWPALGVLGILLYVYKQINYRTLILVYSGMFTLIYAFANFSFLDLAYWLAVFVLILIEKE